MILDAVTRKLHTARTLTTAGMIHPVRPDKLMRMGMLLREFGPTPAAAFGSAAIQHPGETAVIDDLGTLTFRDLHERSNALANSLSREGIKEGDSVAIMCRNHRGFIDATIALSKLGANALFLNTAFAAPQITDVCEREKPVALIYDEEFEELIHDAAKQRRRFIAWHEDAVAGETTLESLIESGETTSLKAPTEKGRVVILTSGTTGTPKGANRSQPASLDPAAALLSKIPLRSRENTMIAAPLFHSWGFAHFMLGMALSSTYVLTRKFESESALSLTAQHECTNLVVVPVMLQRILELDADALGRYDLSALRVIAVSGSALPGPLASEVMDVFGDKLYNLYGSTEVAWATIATPADLRAAPGTAGRPPRGTIVKLYDEQENEVSQGTTGRIFVGNEMMFEGYTGGGNKEVISGLMSTGDVGHFDEGGRLFVDGRDDEMIVSGGENVFPAEVEDQLASHEAVAEVAIIGVEDEKFGQRLKAFVVLKAGKQLSESDAKQWIKEHLASFKVPREFVFMDELPRNATGKVLKRELAQD